MIFWSLMRHLGLLLLFITALSVPLVAQSQNTPTHLPLTTVLTNALAHNQDLQDASENIRLSFAKTLNYQGQFAPILSAGALLSAHPKDAPFLTQTQWTAGATWTTTWGWSLAPNLGLYEADPHLGTASLQFSLPLLGKTMDYYAQLAQYYSADLAQAKATYLYTKSTIVSQVVTAYWNWVSAKHKVELTTTILGERQNMAQSISRLVTYQVRPSSDVLQAQVQVLQAQLNSLDAQNTEVQTAQALSILTGTTITTTQTGDPLPATELPTTEPDDNVITRRQDYLALRSYFQSQLGYAQSQLLQQDPALTLTTGIELDTNDNGLQGLKSSLQNGQLAYLVGVNIAFPFINDQKESARQTYQIISHQSNRKLDYLHQLILTQCRISRFALQTAWKTTQLAQTQEQNYGQIFNNEQKKMNLGLSSFLDVLLQEQSLENARFQYLQAQTNYAVAMVQWGTTSGQLIHADGSLDWTFILGETRGN